MKVFCSFRTLDKKESEKIISQLNKNQLGINFLTHTTIESNEKIWKQKVSEKIDSSFAVIFFIGKKTYSSDAVNWEFEETLKANKKIIVVFLDKDGITVPNFLKEPVTIVESNPDTILEELSIIYKQDERLFNLLLEQYKIMISSSEKVTSQRLTVNNLFFTVTAAVLSTTFLILKDLEFNIVSILILLASFTMAFVITKFWKKMICSYGLLNKGKFILIAELENDLKINLFQREWDILINKVKYQSNTETETKIIDRFRVFIIIIGVFELLYLVIKNFEKLKEFINYR